MTTNVYDKKDCMVATYSRGSMIYDVMFAGRLVLLQLFFLIRLPKNIQFPFWDCYLTLISPYYLNPKRNE